MQHQPLTERPNPAQPLALFRDPAALWLMEGTMTTADEGGHSSAFRMAARGRKQQTHASGSCWHVSPAEDSSSCTAATHLRRRQS